MSAPTANIKGDQQQTALSVELGANASDSRAATSLANKAHGCTFALTVLPLPLQRLHHHRRLVAVLVRVLPRVPQRPHRLHRRRNAPSILLCDARNSNLLTHPPVLGKSAVSVRNTKASICIKLFSVVLSTNEDSEISARPVARLRISSHFPVGFQDSPGRPSFAPKFKQPVLQNSTISAHTAPPRRGLRGISTSL